MDTAKYIRAVERHKTAILAAERYLWRHPQTGFGEWLADKYLADRFIKAGYELRRAGDIPGFTTVIDTGRPGPRVLVLGEMDALLCFDHPEADKRTGAVHACGHCAQAAALLGIALSLKQPGVLDDMCGSICLCAVPAEELIELERRDELRARGVIRYAGGKVEFLHRGYFDGCDMAIMVHTSASNRVFEMHRGGNGCVIKQIEYIGRASHAGGAPHLGINALYAAELGIQAVNSLRETFRDGDHIRFHPIITSGGTVVNAIPARVTLESYVRGATLTAIARANGRINRALAASAAAIGAQVRIRDRPGYAPLINDPLLTGIAAQAARAIVGEAAMEVSDAWSSGCTDMGDLSAVMPAVHPYAGGAAGAGHGADYRIIDPYVACVRSAQLQLVMLGLLLSDDAAQARQVIASARPRFTSAADYFRAMDAFELDREMVRYGDDGSVTLLTGASGGD